MKRALLLGSATSFSVLFYGAARAYPGGSYFDRAAVGNDFWRNTMCDVARGVALDGQPNPLGSLLARLAMIILALGLGVFFTLLPRLFPDRARLGGAVRTLGWSAVPGAIAVVLLPTDRFSAVHGLAIVAAGIPGIGATLLAVFGLLRGRGAPRFVAALGLLATLSAAAGFGLYVRELVFGGPAQVAVAVLERVATVLLVAWMLAVAARPEARDDDAPVSPRPSERGWR
jgi:hypothetical protein